MAPPPPPIDPHSLVVRVGDRRGLFFDFYARLLRAPWHRVILLFATFYAVANAAFAALYLLAGDAIQNARPGWSSRSPAWSRSPWPPASSSRSSLDRAPGSCSAAARSSRSTTGS